MLSGGRCGSSIAKAPNPDPSSIDHLPLIGIIVGILILTPVKGGGLLIRGLHYNTEHPQNTFQSRRGDAVGTPKPSTNSYGLNRNNSEDE